MARRCPTTELALLCNLGLILINLNHIIILGTFLMRTDTTFRVPTPQLNRNASSWKPFAASLPSTKLRSLVQARNPLRYSGGIRGLHAAQGLLGDLSTQHISTYC